MALVCPQCRNVVKTVGKVALCPEHGPVMPLDTADEAMAANDSRSALSPPMPPANESKSFGSIFLSYARGDDEPFVRRLYEDLAANGLRVWFDRVSLPSRNLTFHQEIRDAIATHDRLVFVVGPKAVASQYVSQEWQFAYFEAEKIVTPILRQGDFPLIPDELKLLHCEDFRTDADYAIHRDPLLRILNEPTPRLGEN